MRRWDALKNNENTNRIIAIATLAIAAATIVTTCVVVKGSSQTDKLVTAADKQADAAKSFADSATNINLGIKDAVDKLNIQAGELDESAKQMSRLATATEKANANVIDNDRPWIGVAMRIDPLEVGKIPTVDVSMINTGKRPAKVTSMEFQGQVFTVFPKIPPYKPQGPPSTAILMPGFPTSSKYNVTNESITQETMNVLTGRTATLYEYIKVEYVDVRTGTSHHTHACWNYIPETKAFAAGFYSCTEYQDAD